MSSEKILEEIRATKSRTSAFKSKFEERKRARERALQNVREIDNTNIDSTTKAPHLGSACLSVLPVESEANTSDVTSSSKTHDDTNRILSEDTPKLDIPAKDTHSVKTAQPSTVTDLSTSNADERTKTSLTASSSATESGRTSDSSTAVTLTLHSSRTNRLTNQIDQMVASALQNFSGNPMSFKKICRIVNEEESSHRVSLEKVISCLERFSANGVISLQLNTPQERSNSSAVENRLVVSVDFNRIIEIGHRRDSPAVKKRAHTASDFNKPSKSSKTSDEFNLQDLLAAQTAKEKQSTKLSDEIRELLNKPTAKDKYLTSMFKSQKGSVQEYCPHGTKAECRAVSTEKCTRVHFVKIMNSHTDESLGDCSFLNTCFNMDTCKFIHYKIDQTDLLKPELGATSSASKGEKSTGEVAMMPAQWVQCDLRTFDMSVLGKFAVVMADPPWDIHMELPYGTMSDEEMMNLNVPTLQDEGYIFLWVTIRAMELGRECLDKWGYERCDELIWVKTNQLQRLIRTGRTGHWINHGKEHCLVGVKGKPKLANRGLDCDVIVAEVRATSHKPDEVYGIIERLSPGTRKLELFGRPHNTQPNWLTLGNQLAGVNLHEQAVIDNFKRKYPDGNCLGGQKR